MFVYVMVNVLYVGRNIAATRRVPRQTTSVPLCQGDISKCFSVNIPVNRFTDGQTIRPVTSPKRSNFSPRVRSTTLAHPKRSTHGFIAYLDRSTTLPAWISGSDKSTSVAVGSDRQPSMIYSVEDLEASEVQPQSGWTTEDLH